MPTYEYACAECGERLEAVQKFSDDPLTTCPACGGRLRKLFSPVGIVFKGSGFYRTDSRGAANGAKDKQLNGSSGDSSAPSEKSSGADAKSSSDSGSSSGSASSSGSGSSSGSESSSGSGSSAGAKPDKKDRGGSGKPSATGTKVA